MSLHHTHTIHSSGPKRSDYRRIGYAVNYIQARVCLMTEPRATVLPVRGQDRHGYFDHETRLSGAPLSAAARQAHEAAYARYAAATGISR